VTAQLILGKEVSESIYADLRMRIAALKARGITPVLALIAVGDDPASKVYLRTKNRKCEELGIKAVNYTFPSTVSEEEVLGRIMKLNDDRSVHGILVQLPLPPNFEERYVLDSISPGKDVDCFHPINVGHMFIGDPRFLPATAGGIQQMLIHYGIETSGKHVVIVGRSNIVGKPMAAILMQNKDYANSTVTVLHSKSSQLKEILLSADIIISAVGKAKFITADMVKEGAVVIDVGTNRIPDPSSPKGSRLVGDVDFDAVKEKASYITPVPGGVGPMTVCMLMANTVKAAEGQW
jgi:methylenetetrahydrofolate dehydrogenase (NADP+)/methenyltetrahydrofolate cyclohydrolase